jgi:hypothetical protein
MAYIGNTTQVANTSYRVVDDISAGFNGVTTSFAFKVSGNTPSPFPLNPQNCIISVNNVLLKPDVTTAEGFWFSGTNIVFKVAPTSGQKFWGVVLAGADYVTAGSLYPDGTVTAPSITFASNTSTGLFVPSTGTIGISTSGVKCATFDNTGQFLLTANNCLGYGTGSGGAVTQTGSRTATVVLSKPSGAITLVSAAGSTTYQTFTVTNTLVLAKDVVHVSQKSGTDKYAIWVTAIVDGSFNITFATLSGTTVEQPVFNFAIIRATTA